MFSKSGKLLAVIPARSGSKGLPGKNIKNLAGKPMIAWTIEAAQNSHFIDHVIVSTDSLEIKEIAEQFGAWVPFLRPHELAQDNTEMNAVIKHLLYELKNTQQLDVSDIILLQPTSPLRTSQDIDHACERYYQCNDYPNATLISVSEVSRKYHWLMAIDDNGFGNFLLPLEKNKLSRQHFPHLFLPNGAIYIASAYNFTGFYSDKSILFPMDGRSSIDIDDSDDFIQAENFLKYNLNVGSI